MPEAPSVASKGILSKSEKSSKARRPQPLIKLVMRRFVSSFKCSISRSLYFDFPVCFLLFMDTYCSFFSSVRLESSFRSFSRPVLHAAARVVQEMGKSRAAAYSLGAYDEAANLQSYSDNVESLDSDLNENSQPEGTMILL